MNRDEILNMPAGREMDALVAEKVMEWHMVKWVGWCNDNDILMHSVFFPSTDISAAWEVVEKLTMFSIAGPIPGKPYFSVWVYIKGKGHTNTTGETAPLAICKAALISVMEL